MSLQIDTLLRIQNLRKYDFPVLGKQASFSDDMVVSDGPTVLGMEHNNLFLIASFFQAIFLPAVTQ